MEASPQTAAGILHPGSPQQHALPSAKTGSLIIANVPGLRNGSLIQVLASLLWLVQAGLLAYAVQGFASGSRFADAVMPALLILLIGIIRAGLDMAGTRIIFGAARKAVMQLREYACSAMATRSPFDPGRQPSGTAASLIAEQTEAVLPFLLKFSPVQYKLLIVPIVILICVARFSWLAALILMIAAPLVPIFMALIGYRAKKASEAQMVEVGAMNAFLLDRLRGLTSIRALDAVDSTALRFRKTADTLKKKTMAVLRIAFLSSAVLELFSALGVAMVAVYVGFHLLGQIPYGTWGYRLSLGEGLFILLLAPAFFEPLQDLSAAWHDRASGKAAIDALDNLSSQSMPLLGALRDETGQAPSSSPPGITFENITFRHGNAARDVFKGFSLQVRPGEKLAVLGPSGSGKSTLLAMLAGLVPATSGRIIVGDIVMTDTGASTARQRMAWIGQKPHLFSGTLRSNIVLGRSNIDDARITSALDISALKAVAASHSGPIGEGGSGLSGGEALRLALARAAADPGTDLILADEPTAHLDSSTAAEVADGLLSLAAGKTLIVATHDETLAARMDRIIRVEPAP